MQQVPEPSTQVLKSVCRSCHGGCGTLLHVTDGRLTKVAGDRDSPLNRGRLCPIGMSTLDLVYHPARLKYPLRRTGARGEGQQFIVTARELETWTNDKRFLLAFVGNALSAKPSLSFFPRAATKGEFRFRPLSYVARRQPNTRIQSDARKNGARG